MRRKKKEENMRKQALTDRRLSKFSPPFKEEVQVINGKIHELEEIVRRHGVTWNLSPEYHVDRDQRRIQIGFEFSLVGAHEHSQMMVEPGCPECITIYEDLQQIAEWLAPKER